VKAFQLMNLSCKSRTKMFNKLKNKKIRKIKNKRIRKLKNKRKIKIKFIKMRMMSLLTMTNSLVKKVIWTSQTHPTKVPRKIKSMKKRKIKNKTLNNWIEQQNKISLSTCLIKIIIKIHFRNKVNVTWLNYTWIPKGKMKPLH